VYTLQFNTVHSTTVFPLGRVSSRLGPRTSCRPNSLLWLFSEDSLHVTIFLSAPWLDPTIGLVCVYCLSYDSELGSLCLLRLPRTQQFHESKLEADYRDHLQDLFRKPDFSFVSISNSKTRLKRLTPVWSGPTRFLGVFFAILHESIGFDEHFLEIQINCFMSNQ
jgi:hypothetical protein